MSEHLSETVAEIKARLAALQPLKVEVVDESALHVGHAGAGGGGHYRLILVSAAFTGQLQVMRHRLVYQALGDLMTGKIHALSISALAPDEL